MPKQKRNTFVPNQKYWWTADFGCFLYHFSSMFGTLGRAVKRLPLPSLSDYHHFNACSSDLWFGLILLSLAPLLTSFSDKIAPKGPKSNRSVVQHPLFLAGLSLQHPRVKYEERLQPPSPCRVRRLQPPMTWWNRTSMDWCVPMKHFIFRKNYLGFYDWAHSLLPFSLL